MPTFHGGGGEDDHHSIATGWPPLVMPTICFAGEKPPLPEFPHQRYQFFQPNDKANDIDVRLAAIGNGSHEALRPAAATAWAFMSGFARSADGSVVSARG
ncbi:hypothetical protein [Umezawaea sp. Da 62-37]|uniref:hypothetical protein n=1 Tax=Umezawaea sp. Da 62-37 TaxID=3075927 RepID=UPI0028F723F2|nr:hypothetical protein [Umezawaea sp. Da 62-37]WNV87053.1 hypothetical protein RM788_01820 [Umezawaea sp. Da 62-37]